MKVTKPKDYYYVVDFLTQILNIPFKNTLFLGNKCDLEDERVVGKDQGLNLARQFNNCSFMETSAKAKIGVKDVSSKISIFYGPCLFVCY